MPLIPYEKVRGQVYDVDLLTPPRSRWGPTIDHVADDLHALMADILDLCQGSLAAFPGWIKPLVRTALHGGARLGGHLVGLIARLFGQDYEAEIAGIAKRAELPFAQVLLANFIYDGTQAYERLFACPSSIGPACSSYSCNLRGTPVLARNMDWAWPDTIGKRTILVRFHRGRQSYLSVGIVGMVGVLSAMCAGKWAVTINQAPAEHLPINALQWPVLQRLRAVCDGFGTFRTVVSRLQQFQTATPFFAHVVGVEADEHAVVQGFGREFAVRRLTRTSLIQTNHYVPKEFEHYNAAIEEWTDTGGQQWVLDSRPRYEALDRRLKTLPKTLDEGLDKLKRPPVTSESTQQRMVFSPATGAYRLQVRT